MIDVLVLAGLSVFLYALSALLEMPLFNQLWDKLADALNIPKCRKLGRQRRR